MSQIETLRDLVYAVRQGAPMLLDIYRPLGVAGPLPVIVYIPGGGWRNSRKADGPGHFAAHGFAVACINYRITPGAIAPANVHDCKAAVRWVRAHAKEFDLDPNRIGVWGGSAGGHLAALLGLTNDLPDLEGGKEGVAESSAVQAACDFCGPSDLSRIGEPRWRVKFPTLYDVTAAYLGGPVEQQTELAKLVSPMTYVRGGVPPIFIAHGDADPVVPLIESTAFHEALLNAGVDSTLHVVPGGDHGIHRVVPDTLVVDFFRRAM